MGKHLEQALPSVYTLQCLTGKVDNNNNNYNNIAPFSNTDWSRNCPPVYLRDDPFTSYKPV